MYSRTERLREEIEKAKQRIASLFLEQCRDGAQTNELQGDACACGQFLCALTKVQRGIHGTAAALYVLGLAGNKDADAELPGLVSYVEKRRELENKHKGADEYKCRQDESNVIKTSELLLALKRAKPIVPKEELLKGLADRLKNGMSREGSWPYFMNSDGDPAHLPTAYASAALQAFGYTSEAAKSRECIFRHLKRDYTTRADLYRRPLVDLTIDVFCLYVLTFENPLQNRENDLRKIFRTMWRRLKGLIETGSEQNVEYWYEQKESCYIRVPWELYMIALSTHYDFKKSFSSFSVQRRKPSVKYANLYLTMVYNHCFLAISSVSVIV